MAIFSSYNMDLSPILDLGMTSDEALAYKTCCNWLKIAKELFPEYRHTGLPKRQDVRKSVLFKWCFKLVRETKGIIAEDDLPNYIRAQLQIILIMTKGQEARVEANCLVGDRAWRRWKIWQKHHQRQKMSAEQAGVTADPGRIIKEIRGTRTHLEGRFGGIPTEDQFLSRRRDIANWLIIGRLTPYYGILSPWVAKHVSIKNSNLDLNVYRRDITSEVEVAFRTIFAHEFN